MTIRDFKESDRIRLKEILETQYGNAYLFPVEETCIARVLADTDDKPLCIIAARPAVELLMVIDKGSWEVPGRKFELFQAIHEDVRQKLEEKGYKSGIIRTCLRSFARKLKKRLGWDNYRESEQWEVLTRKV